MDIPDRILDRSLEIILGERPLPKKRGAWRGQYKHKKRRKSKAIKEEACRYRQKLVNHETPAESLMKEILWSLGIHFDFQKIFFTRRSFFITDFYLPRHKIVVEVDGSQHHKKKQARYDRNRTRYLEKVRGLEVIRLMNGEVLHEPDKIKAFFQRLPEPLGYDNKSGSNPIVEVSESL